MDQDTPSDLPALYHGMLRIRRLEEELAKRYSQQEMRCPMHLCIGEEAIAVGLCAQLTAQDLIFGNHRSHGHYLAKGGDMNTLVAEIYGKETGCCGGRGGSMHLIDPKAGFSGSVPIVGGTVPLAVGASWAFKLKKEQHVAAVFFGDGCFEEGVLHESMNFAALKKIPVLFICENNGLSVYTPIQERQPDRPISDIAKAHGLQIYTGNGNNVQEVAQLSQEAVKQARNGGGPQFLELSTTRWLGHVGPDPDDDLGYRPHETDQYRKSLCPLKLAQSQLQQSLGWKTGDFDQLEKTVQIEVDAAFQFTFDSPNPRPETRGDLSYAQ
jgi:TPP-dependent pyruvate/acetoin dehydrogenase alpha subunit